jgi:hypothetical protein
MAREHEVDGDRQRVDEVRGVRDDDAVVGSRPRREKARQQARAAFAAPAPRETGDAQGAASSEIDASRRVHQTSDDCVFEDLTTGWARVAIGREHPEGRIESDAFHQLAQVVGRLLLGPTAERVLHVVPRQDDQVRPVRQTRSQRVLLASADRRRLYVGDVEDAEGSGIRGTAAGVHGMPPRREHLRLDEVGIDVDGKDDDGERGEHACA